MSPLGSHPGGDAELLPVPACLPLVGLSGGPRVPGEPSAAVCSPPPLFSGAVLQRYGVFLSPSQEHGSFFDLVRDLSGQPRSLQHLCRCALRQHLGARCHSAIGQLAIPASVREYLLLHNDGTLH